ncbi:MAG: hypothetical protein LAT68_06080 [Cyclobacteriaceae bacterium]|nr:hypothetical protein [Cyclobacteriaceae bacterium]MCH8515879.1 hypothetical protein [Cyclobacteriaceae bacterium]
MKHLGKILATATLGFFCFFATTSLTSAASNDAETIDGNNARVFSGEQCSGSGGNCLDTVVVKPKWWQIF